MILTSLLRAMFLAAAAVVASGCATIPPDAGNNPADPWERYNRNMFEFNDAVDRAILKPVAEGYEQYVPEPVRECVSNFFNNLRDVPIALNNLLQGKVVDAVSDVCRVAINSTVGVFGCFDVATAIGLERHDEDFGQTLGVWGFDPGPYLVLPLLGPSTVRDAVGRVPGYWLNPQVQLRTLRERPWLFGIDVLDLRASLLPAERAFEGIALDRYQFIRDAYLQRRRSLVYDGEPPSDQVPTYEDPEEDPPAAKTGTQRPTDGPARPAVADEPGA